MNNAASILTSKFSSRLVINLILLILLNACGGSGDSSIKSDQSPQFKPEFSSLQPYIADGPYASVLKNCVSISDQNDSCSLNTLPPIGLDSITPTVDDVMNHVVVSHTWMGDRMRELLEQMPADMLFLLRANTAIVIDADIRPAYFWSVTGAIYIDPAFLWTTNEEKATVNKTEDFRSNFGNELQFKRLWRYIINNDYAWTSYSLDGTEERTSADTLVLTTWLFYHELAHANDCLPPSELGNLNRSNSYFQNFLNIRDSGRCIHDRLTALEPLTSSLWDSLAQVLYHGETANNSQKTMSAEFVAAEFITDVASDSYSYSSIWEDTAMLFEEILMKRTFNAQRDLVIVDFYDEFSCEAVLVKWGQRGRLGDELVIERAKFIVAEMLPELDLVTFFAEQPEPFEIPLGSSYCTRDYSSTVQVVDYSDEQSTGKQLSIETMLQLENQREID